MIFRMKAVVVGVLCVVCSVAFSAEAQPADRAKIRALIFSGRNNHDWKTTTPCLQKMYEESGRFFVEVTNDPSTCTAESLSKYDVIVDNWSAFPEMTGRQWGETAENAVLDFIREGKGFVVIHAATACFEDWPEFLEIAGCAWRENAGHSQHHAFTVSITDEDHPITKGMTDFVSATDELYHRQTPCASMKVLATVYSDPAKNGTGDDEPAAVWTTYGKGRCFNNILGHDVAAMNGVGYRTLMLRGTEWAATGAVTIPIPEEWPAANRPIRAAVITGGHGFDKAAFPPLFQGHGDIECTILPQEDDSEIFEDIADWPYDVIVLYNMSQKISAKRRQNFLKLLNQGVGVVGLHHAIAAFKEWPTFEQIIGARYFLKDTVEGDVTHPRSTYEHDTNFTLHVADPSHPITHGMRDFQVHDETYNDWLLLPDVHLLMTSDHPDCGPGIAWTKTFAKAKVCFIQPGHGPSIFADPNYKHLVAQAIRWTAGRLDDDYALLFKSALDGVTAYEHGQSRAGLYRMAELVRSALKNPNECAVAEAELLAALQSDATFAAKDFLCKQLSFVATEQSVPVLAPMLMDKQMSQLARYALVRIPGTAANEVLRSALPNTSGDMKVGIINSLGDRRDAAVVGALAALLSHSDAVVAEAAAAALGKIGNAEAADALASETGNAAAHESIVRALLQCADRLRQDGDAQKAAQVFESVHAASEAGPLKVAAFRGLVVSRGEAGAPLLATALTGDDASLYPIALRLARSLPGAGTTQALANTLPAVPAERKTLLLDALADRGDAAARAAVVAAAKDSEKDVRIAALKALGVLGDASSVPLLAETAAVASGLEKKAAREALTCLHHPAVDAALLEGLNGAPGPVRIEMMRAMAERLTPHAAPALLQAAKDADASVREEALKALGVLGSAEELPALVDLLASAQSDGERSAAEAALVAVARRMPPEPSPSEMIVARVPAGVTVPTRCAVLRVLGEIADAPALKGVRAGLEEGAPSEIRDAAVRALANWPTPEALDDLRTLAKGSGDETHRVLALRGFIRLLGMSKQPDGERVKLYAEAMELASRADERKQVLSGLGSVAHVDALQLAVASAGDAEVQAEATATTLAIARAMDAQHAEETEAALAKLLEITRDEKAREEARALMTNVRLRALQANSIASQGTASSPDDLDKDGGAHGDAAAIDGNPDTYWDEVDNQDLYVLQVDFPEAKDVAAISILGYRHQDYAPKDFQIVCDGHVVSTVEGASYSDNLLLVGFPKQQCKLLQLKITGYYGASPGIRELGIYSVAP